jgi:acetyl-CoA carboxylase biotin carboxylase subunit
VDKHVYSGYVIPPYYDSMIAKLICYGRDRRTAMDRMSRALDEFILRGVKTTIPLHKLILKDPNFRRGRYSTSFVERLMSTATQAGLVLPTEEPT